MHLPTWFIRYTYYLSNWCTSEHTQGMCNFVGFCMSCPTAWWGGTTLTLPCPNANDNGVLPSAALCWCSHSFVPSYVPQGNCESARPISWRLCGSVHLGMQVWLSHPPLYASSCLCFVSLGIFSRPHMRKHHILSWTYLVEPSHHTSVLTNVVTLPKG